MHDVGGVTTDLLHQSWPKAVMHTSLARHSWPTTVRSADPWPKAVMHSSQCSPVQNHLTKAKRESNLGY